MGMEKVEGMVVVEEPVAIVLGEKRPSSIPCELRWVKRSVVVTFGSFLGS
jgi:hypothetical protein